MTTKIKALQIGLNNLKDNFSEEEKNQLDWIFFKIDSAKEDIKKIIDDIKGRTFDVVVCTDQLDNELLQQFAMVIESYGLIIDQKLRSFLNPEFSKKKCPIFMDFDEQSVVIHEIIENFFSKQSGTKLHTHMIVVDDTFDGKQNLFGENFLQIEDDFSKYSTQPLLTWQYNITLNQRSKKLWLEFKHTNGIRISMTILIIQSGTSQIIKKNIYSEEEVKNGIEIDYKPGYGYLSISLSIEGKGTVEIGPLHYRDSRHQYGEFILGGEKIKDESNQEIFYYFNPGDLQPPLNVYFAGYHGAEGFEGFFMMKRLGAPFLLITDPRLEGGSFYMGSKELENKLFTVIQEKLNYLHFSQQELILSGLSMGTYGAMYYASQLNPAYIIVGKPLVNVGDIAVNERIVRPGEFGTSLDILKSLTGGLSPAHVQRLNQRFWDTFSQSNFSQTKFIVTYMKNDDYDDKAYLNLTEYLSAKKSIVIGKGLLGRHNDNSPGIIQWFIKQYKRILKEEFQRSHNEF